MSTAHQQTAQHAPTTTIVTVTPDIARAWLEKNSRNRHITTSPVLAAVAIASNHEDHEQLREFAEILVSGMPDTQDDVAAIRLREQLMAHQSRGGQTARRETLHKTMRAIKAFCARERLQRLYTPPEMPYRIDGLEDFL